MPVNSVEQQPKMVSNTGRASSTVRLIACRTRAVAVWHTEQVFKTYRGAAQPDFKFHGANDNMPMMATGGLMGDLRPAPAGRPVRRGRIDDEYRLARGGQAVTVWRASSVISSTALRISSSLMRRNFSPPIEPLKM